MNNGFLYVAKGEKYIAEAINSVKSLRESGNSNTCLVTDIYQEGLYKHFDKIIIHKQEPDLFIIQNDNVRKNWVENIAYKIQGINLSPFEKTMFLDTDTFILDSVAEVFIFLDYFDILGMADPGDLSMPTINGNVIKGLHPINTGVLLYRKNEQIKDLLTNWFNIFTTKYQIYSQDQPAFTEALAFSDVRFFCLSVLYHLRTNCPVSIPNNKVKVLHGRNFERDRIENRVNGQQTLRSWIPSLSITIRTNKRYNFCRDFIFRIIFSKY
jgi:hypothetical protein